MNDVSDNKIMCHLKFPGGSTLPVRPIKIQFQKECIKKYSSNCTKSNLYNVILCTLGDHFKTGDGSVSKLFLGGVPLSDLTNAFIQDYTLCYGFSKHFSRIFITKRLFYKGIGKWNILDLSDIIVNETRIRCEFTGNRPRIKNVPVWGIYLMYRLMLLLVHGKLSVEMLRPVKLAIQQAVKEMKNSVDYSLEPVSVESTEYDLRFHTRNIFNIYLFELSVEPETFVYITIHNTKYLPILSDCKEMTSEKKEVVIEITDEEEVKEVKEVKEIKEVKEVKEVVEEEEEQVQPISRDDKTMVSIYEQLMERVIETEEKFADTEENLTQLIEMLARKYETIEINMNIRFDELDDRITKMETRMDTITTIKKKRKRI